VFGRGVSVCNESNIQYSNALLNKMDIVMDNPKPMFAAAVAGAVTSYFKLNRYIPVPGMMLDAVAGVAAFTVTDKKSHKGEFLPFGQFFAIFAGMAGGLAVDYLGPR
jgi:hypothetical protein